MVVWELKKKKKDINVGLQFLNRIPRPHSKFLGKATWLVLAIAKHKSFVICIVNVYKSQLNYVLVKYFHVCLSKMFVKRVRSVYLRFLRLYVIYVNGQLLLLRELFLK